VNSSNAELSFRHAPTPDTVVVVRSTFWYFCTMNKLDPALIQPCLVCGQKNVQLEAMRLAGREKDVWRVACGSCGQTSQQWSVSQGAAIRAWNRNLAHAASPPSPDQEG
jgi:hypothetical protein